METYTLHQVNSFIKQALAINFEEPLWVKAEVAQQNPSNGNIYFTLIQKEASDIVAQADAALWNSDFTRLSFDKKTFINQLPTNAELLFLVQVTMHERYGLKLKIVDVDVAYTLGVLEKQRLEAIESLKAQDLLNLNKGVPASLVFQRIAVLSNEGAAGFQDFKAQLATNSFGYAFKLTLIKVAVQGQRVYPDIAAALEMIQKRSDEFDCVAIIRGGGGKMDLVEFDGFELCKLLALFPLPIITGIGHEVDQSVADLVAYNAQKTPTAAAQYFIEKMLYFEQNLLQAKNEIGALVQQKVQEEKQFLAHKLALLQSESLAKLHTLKHEMVIQKERTAQEVSRKFEKMNYRLEKATLEVQANDPRHQFKRGFFLVEGLDGKPIKTVAALKKEKEAIIRQSTSKVKINPDA